MDPGQFSGSAPDQLWARHLPVPLPDPGRLLALSVLPESRPPAQPIPAFMCSCFLERCGLSFILKSVSCLLTQVCLHVSPGFLCLLHHSSSFTFMSSSHCCTICGGCTVPLTTCHSVNMLNTVLNAASCNYLYCTVFFEPVACKECAFLACWCLL